MIVDLRGTLISSEQQVAREKWRLIVAPDAGLGLPARVRISVPLEALDHLPAPGARVAVRARSTAPPEAALPGGYDFQRQAWFQGIGAVGKALGPVVITQDRQTPGLRDRLSAHIARHVPEAASGVAIALVTGDVGRISVDDQQAMRTSGLAHLLSVSGLHLSAVVGAIFFLTLRLLALITAFAPAPDLLVTGDGRHMAVRDAGGQWFILRPRAGDFVRQALAERAGFGEDLADLDGARAARFSADACFVRMTRGGQSWMILAIRSPYRMRWADLVTACAQADILISARRLPRACRAKRLKVDPDYLKKTGGLAISLAPLSITTVRPPRDDHPWMATALAD